MSNLTPQKFRNAFIANNSVILNEGKIVRDSCVGEEFYKKYRRPGFRLKYFLPLFSFAKKPHILITDEWSKNYCHWLWEALSKLIVITQNFPPKTDLILVLPSSYKKIDFVMKSLAAFGFNDSNIKFVPKKSQLRVGDLTFIPCMGIATEGYYDFLKFSEVRQTLLAHYQEKLKTNFGARIYISRSDPKKNTARKVANETELTAMLAKYGFKTVYMENFSFLEQVSISNFAEFIVAPHGAGITNVMFARAKSHLIEMVSSEYGKTCFAHMCDKMNIAYDRIECPAINNGKVSVLQDITVDVANLEKKLTEILPK